ncbi:unnamed protein product, partial [Musa textilis]
VEATGERGRGACGGNRTSTATLCVRWSVSTTRRLAEPGPRPLSFLRYSPHLFFPRFLERIKISMIFVVDRYIRSHQFHNVNFCMINHVGHGDLLVADVQKT